MKAVARGSGPRARHIQHTGYFILWDNRNFIHHRMLNGIVRKSLKIPFGETKFHMDRISLRRLEYKIDNLLCSLI